MKNEIIEFTRTKPFTFVKKTGDGALGKTILLKDEVIDELFVCKKYSPYSSSLQEEFFDNFKNEIKLLHLLYHDNIVRVFNYYLYPEKYLGYIFMEHVDGVDIETYIKSYPENINDVFVQLISGFNYLEKHNILHRDIRPSNVMVTHDGIVKIIDFGFGKRVQYEQDFDKSISLNWWCDIPNDFEEKKYNFQTEIYFIGKLFEQLIENFDIEQFKYKELLKHMISFESKNRIDSFSSCYKDILGQKNNEINFDDYEIQIYREFSDTLYDSISKIESSTEFINDANQVIKKLTLLHKNTMLEEYLPTVQLLVRCFLNGTYYSKNNSYIRVDIINSFNNMLQSCSQGKRNIIINNLETKLEAIDRYSNQIPKIDIDLDSIPF